MKGRINVETALFTDPDFIRFMVKTGCEDKSIGLWLRATMLAQKNWLEHRCIPEDAWRDEFQPLVDASLIKKVDGGYYLRGSKEQFKWLDQKSKAGRKSGASRRGEIRTDVNECSTESNGEERLGTSISISSSNSYSYSNSGSTSSSYTDAMELTQYWNSEGLKSAKETPPALRAVSDAYDKKSHFGINGNKQAFTNYASVLKGPDTWYTHKYSLVGFLSTPKTQDFYPDEFSYEAYVNKDKIGKAQQIQNNVSALEFSEDDFA